MRNLREELDVLGAEQAGDFILGHFVDRVRREAIDLARVDAGVGQCLQGGFHRQADFGAAGIL